MNCECWLSQAGQAFLCTFGWSSALSFSIACNMSSALVVGENWAVTLSRGWIAEVWILRTKKNPNQILLPTLLLFPRSEKNTLGWGKNVPSSCYVGSGANDWPSYPLLCVGAHQFWNCLGLSQLAWWRCCRGKKSGVQKQLAGQELRGAPF